MEKVFAAQGILDHHLPDYEPRPGQQEMAQAVADLLAPQPGQAFADQENPRADCLLVEAETGLGKTLAYLVPAIASSRKVVVSTNTRNLQDQILKREIPFIQKYIAPNLSAMCVKGRQNYLCLYRWNQLRVGRQYELFADSNADRGKNRNKKIQKSQLKAIDDWLQTTTFADRAELASIGGNSLLWQKICCHSHFCLGSDCPDGRVCFLNTVRRQAAACQLLVVNHHLLFSDLAVRRNGYGEVLPRYDTVIFDEAHHLENVATTFFGFTFSRYQVKDLVNDIEQSLQAKAGTTPQGMGEKQENTLKAVHSLDGISKQFASRFPVAKGRFPLAELLGRQPELEQEADTLAAALDNLADRLAALKSRKNSSQEEPWEQYLQRCHDLEQRLERIMTLQPADTPEKDQPDSEEQQYIHWFERTEKNLTLSATPVDVARDLDATLFASVEHCVFTSATLTCGNSFSYFSKRLGIPEQSQTLSFASPFDYANRCLLYVPDQPFPEPKGQGYREALHTELATLLNHSRGRALLLFTSFQAMDLAWHSLRDSLEYPMFCQGTAPRHELLNRFAEETDSILFAVASFWEGVDVPGESLSMVIIDKLPFEVPTDPVIMARLDRIKAIGGNPFFEFQVPRAILGLRQGVGRLMRRSRDQGVMAVLDVRLFSKSYGRRFLKSLPAAPVSRDMQAVQTFFDNIQEKT
jgi:ATP-dependent DNA helicase DinG